MIERERERERDENRGKEREWDGERGGRDGKWRKESDGERECTYYWPQRVLWELLFKNF